VAQRHHDTALADGTGGSGSGPCSGRGPGSVPVPGPGAVSAKARERPRDRPRAGRTPVRAAGAVLWRRPPYDPDAPLTGRRAACDSGVEIALVHRPKYDDWSHPKGKLRPGEDWLAAAVREVREETGMECVPGPQLPAAHYLVGDQPKEVRYWAAEATTGTFTPNREVNRVLWLPPAAARHRLTHDWDRALVDALLGVLRGAA
jgi:8-oxo-dGTP diphosphatase